MSVFKIMQVAVLIMLIPIVFLATIYVENSVIVEKLYVGAGITLMIFLLRLYSHKSIKKTENTNTY